MTYLIAFGVFAVAVAAMGVGVFFSGRKLSSSCGGIAAQGESVDCTCARKEAQLCTDGPEQELVDLAEIGWPMKRERHTHAPQAKQPKADAFQV